MGFDKTDPMSKPRRVRDARSPRQTPLPPPPAASDPAPTSQGEDAALPPPVPPSTKPIKLTNPEIQRLSILKQNVNNFQDKLSGEALRLQTIEDETKRQKSAYKIALKEVVQSRDSLAKASTEIAKSYGVPEKDLHFWRISLNTMTLHKP